MSKVKAVLKFIGELIVILGALSCILVWLDVKPTDFRAMTLPHWIWLFAGFGLFIAAISSSSYSLWRSLRGDKAMRKRLATDHEAEMKVITTAHRNEIKRLTEEHTQELEHEHSRFREAFTTAITDLEKSGQLTVLADEARVLCETINHIFSDATTLGDDNALKAIEHPFDATPLRQIADSGPWEWYLRSLSRFQAAYREHQARIAKYSPLAKENIYQNADENVSIQSAIKMLTDHQQALLDQATELRKPYENLTGSQRTVHTIETGSALGNVVAQMAKQMNRVTESFPNRS
jgi:hypothetical protein